MSYTWVAVTKDLWHARLGHIGESAVRTLAKSASGIVLGDAPFSVCEACIKGKHPRSPHPASSSRASQLLDLLHSDICGPFPVRTPHSKLYFIILMDNYSHALDLHLLASRDQALDAFRITHPKWEHETRRRVGRLHMDSAGEFLSEAFTSYLQGHGICRELSAPYAHQQNGRAKRVMRTIQGLMRAMMVAVGAPLNLWGEATLACAYLFWRTPSISLPGNITPFEAFYGRQPNVSHLHVWGCRCFARIPSELQTKLGIRSRECIFMGYPDGVKGYHVRDRSSGSFFVSRDVLFDEGGSGLDVDGDAPPLFDFSPGLEDDPIDDASPPVPVDDALPSDLNSLPAVNSSPPDVDVPIALSPAPLGSPSVPSHEPSSRVRQLSRLGTQYESSRVLEKARSVKLSAAWHARHNAIDARVDPGFPPIAVPPGVSPPEAASVCEHLFQDDYANLICEESAFLSICSNRARNPATASYDMSIPPATYAKAHRQPDFATWDAVVQKEFHNLSSMGVYRLSALPPSRQPVGSRLVFEFKILKNALEPKGRLIAKGFSQIPGIDFGKTFAPVAKATSIRLLAASLVTTVGTSNVLMPHGRSSGAIWKSLSLCNFLMALFLPLVSLCPLAARTGLRWSGSS